VLAIEAGLFGRVPAPAGPVIERYGSAQPWPWDRFPPPPPSAQPGASRRTQRV
jgi:hypothetical protein